MQNQQYTCNFILSYTDENDNLIKRYKIYDNKNGLSTEEEGIHDHKIFRKGIKKLKKQIQEQERILRCGK